MKKLLYITDKLNFSAHSFIDGVMGKYLRYFIDVDIIYWSKFSFVKRGNKYLLPHRSEIAKYIDLNNYDIIIVRNFFYILRRVLQYRRSNLHYKVGFQLLFPHTYRRFHQAKVEKRAVIRKGIEYKINSYFEEKLINQCDFFFPISRTMIDIFYSDIKIPFFVLPLGVDEEYIVKKSLRPHKKINMVYIGTIDKLRRFDHVLEHLANYIDRDWQLDIYSKELPKSAKLLGDKIRFKGYIEREKLLKTISKYDAGLFLVPQNRLYSVASPTKVMEYYQCGIPAVMSNIPECAELFSKEMGFLMDFNNLDFSPLFSCTPEQLYYMGREGQKVLLQKRNYRTISKELYNFIKL